MGKDAPNGHPGSSTLGDFSTNSRVLLLSLMAVPVGAIGAVVA